MEMDEIYPVCPVCGEDCEEIFFDVNNEVCGCDKCIHSRDAYEWAEQEAIEAEAVKGDYEFERDRERRYGII